MYFSGKKCYKKWSNYWLLDVNIGNMSSRYTNILKKMESRDNNRFIFAKYIIPFNHNIIGINSFFFLLTLYRNPIIKPSFLCKCRHSSHFHLLCIPYPAMNLLEQKKMIKEPCTNICGGIRRLSSLWNMYKICPWWFP